MHDVLAVLALAEPRLFDRSRRNVAVETAGRLTRGMTVIDERTVSSRPEPNCDVLTRVDADAAFEHVVAAISTFSGSHI
jgi:inosine-uridine nucleoside N-ribohydrolase